MTLVCSRCIVSLIPVERIALDGVFIAKLTFGVNHRSNCLFRHAPRYLQYADAETKQQD